MIGVDYQDIYVTACGQTLSSHAEGIRHEQRCEQCRAAAAVEDEE